MQAPVTKKSLDVTPSSENLLSVSTGSMVETIGTTVGESSQSFENRLATEWAVSAIRGKQLHLYKTIYLRGYALAMGLPQTQRMDRQHLMENIRQVVTWRQCDMADLRVLAKTLGLRLVAQCREELLQDMMDHVWGASIEVQLEEPQVPQSPQSSVSVWDFILNEKNGESGIPSHPVRPVLSPLSAATKAAAASMISGPASSSSSAPTTSLLGIAPNVRPLSKSSPQRPQAPPSPRPKEQCGLNPLPPPHPNFPVLRVFVAG